MSELATVAVTGRWEHRRQGAARASALDARRGALRPRAPTTTSCCTLLDAAFRVRRAHFGRKVKLNLLVNAKSGICPEDCGYCSQSIVSTAPSRSTQLLSRDVLVDGAREAWARKAGTYCIVASGRRPSARELREVTAAVRQIKEELPLKVCACLGLLTDERGASSSARPGSTATTTTSTRAPTTTRSITTTHTYDDRVADRRGRQACGDLAVRRLHRRHGRDATSSSSTSPSRCASSTPTRSRSTSCTRSRARRSRAVRRARRRAAA